jgi:hypothetical protein
MSKILQMALQYPQLFAASPQTAARTPASAAEDQESL